MSGWNKHVLQKDVFGPWVAMFFTGCVLYFYLPNEPMLSPFWMVLLIPLFWAFRHRYKPVVFLIMLFGVGCGLLWSSYHAMSVGTPLHTTPNDTVDIWGRVDSLETIGNKTRYVLSDLQYDPSPIGLYPKKIRISAPQKADSSIRVGDDIWLKGHLNPLPAPVYPGGFDFARNLYFKSIGAIGYSYAPAELDKVRDDVRFSDRVARLRRGIGNRVDNVLVGQTAAIAKALLIGDRTGVESDTYDEIRRSGLAHIMAISGLHMGMVTGLVYVLLRFICLRVTALTLRVNVKKVAALGAICVGAVYLVLSGASTSTIRAFVMATVVFMAIILDRAPFSFRSIAVAGLVVMLLDPLSVTSAGFQMSFAAVIGLVFMHPYYKPVHIWLKSLFSPRVAFVINAIVALSLTTLTASLTVAPIAAIHFQDVHLGGLASNLIAIPLMGFWVMPIGLLVLLTMPFGLEAIPLTLMGYGVDLFSDVAHHFSQINIGHWMTGAVHVEALGLYGAMLVSLMVLKGRAQWVSSAVFLSMALLTLKLSSLPDVVIAGEKDVAVYRDDRGVYVSSSNRSARFEQSIWAKMLGVEGFEKSDDREMCRDTICAITAYDGAGQPWRLSWPKGIFAGHGTLTLALNDVTASKSSVFEQGRRPWRYLDGAGLSPVEYMPVQIERLNSSE